MLRQAEIDRRKAKNHDHAERKKDSDWTIGSGNVFADLGLPNPEEDLLKSTLVGKISDVIDVRGLTQAQAGEIMGLAQPKVSELLNGRRANPKSTRHHTARSYPADGGSQKLKTLPSESAMIGRQGFRDGSLVQ